MSGSKEVLSEGGMMISQDSLAAMPEIQQQHKQEDQITPPINDYEEIKQEDIMRFIKLCDDALNEKPAYLNTETVQDPGSDIKCTPQKQ